MNRSTLNLQQGTDEWLSARAASDGTASQAPAMAGKSKYQTRTDLLQQRNTGLVKEVDSATQAIFNKGHEAEASARAIAEEIIGEELSPVTYMVEVDGLNLIASLDGITFDDSVIWEHKLWNEKLAMQVQCGELEEHYSIQLDQELLASGAEKCLFMTSDGTRNNFACMWYESSPAKAQALIDGWQQFKADLSTYVPPVLVEKAEAETIQALPVPSVVVRGEITASNLTEITPLFDKYLGAIKSELSTDQDFADAEANAKNCRETAKRIQSLRTNIIAQMVDVNAVDSILANYEEVFNKVGLRLEKAVKEQKESIKTNAILATKQAFFEHIKALETEIAPIRLNVAASDFAGAIKGIKSIGSMHSRLNDALASGKIEADAAARDIRTKLVWFNNYTDYKFLFSDLQSIISKPLDDFMLLVESRVESHKHAELAKEAKIKADAEAALIAKQAAETVERVVFEKPSILPESLQAEFGNQFPPKLVQSEVPPSVNKIVAVVAAAFDVDEMLAHRWLLDANFLEFKKAA